MQSCGPSADQQVAEHRAGRRALVRGDVEVGDGAEHPRTEAGNADALLGRGGRDRCAGREPVSMTTMLVSTPAQLDSRGRPFGHRLSKGAGGGVVVGQPGEMVVKRVPGRGGQDAGLPPSPAQPLAPHPRPGDAARRC